MSTQDNIAKVKEVLDAHLRAVATRDIDLLIRVFAHHAVFIGTDDTEVWTRDQLKELLDGSECGWDMTDVKNRLIVVNNETGTLYALFFELVNHKKYGLLRGSGLVTRGEDGVWVIEQYVLSFSVPNQVVDDTNILELLQR